MADYYPPVSFHFQVTFTGIGQQEHDVKFQSVSGLEAQLETESIKEGGENRFTHQVPTRRKYSDLVLKRGVLLPSQSGVSRWVQDALDLEIVQPIDLQIVLLGEEHSPLMVWDVIHAWPKSWKFSDLDAEKGSLLLETLTLVNNGFKVKQP